MKLVGLTVLALAVPLVLSATAVDTITINVTEDGEDFLLLTGNTLEWEHLSDFANGDITVSGTSSANPGLNFSNSVWTNGIQGNACSGFHGGTLTCPFFDTANEFTLPTGITLAGLQGNVSLTINSCEGGTGSCTGGGSLSILDQPGSNGGTLVVDLNDEPEGATHIFNFTLTWDPPTTTPEPASMALSGAGLIGLGLAGWKRRRKQ
jgi:hypothetical protein